MSQVSTARSRISLFDIRNIVGALLFLYGVILLIASFATSDAEKAKADGVNANLWVGLVLIVAGVFFVAWAVARPIVVDPEQVEKDKREVEEEAKRRSGDTGPAA
jgi:prolipoprotein diacylglyceryltransferase